MPQNDFVVFSPNTGLYCTAYNVLNPPASLFGNANRAVTWPSQEDADNAATSIGGGTVGLPKP